MIEAALEPYPKVKGVAAAACSTKRLARRPMQASRVRHGRLEVEIALRKLDLAI